MGKIDKIIKKEGYLLSILRKIKAEFGYLSEENLIKVSKKTRIPLAKIYSVATFYTSLPVEKKGEYMIKICNSPSCYLNNSLDAIREIEDLLKIKSGGTTKDGKFSLLISSCIGCCDKAPAVRINGKLYGSLTKEKIREILKCRY